MNKREKEGVCERESVRASAAQSMWLSREEAAEFLDLPQSIWASHGINVAQDSVHKLQYHSVEYQGFVGAKFRGVT